VSDKSAADFMHDQLKALFASRTLARVTERHTDGNGDPADFDADSDTEPSIDVQLLRDALRAGLSK
jgi:hypothetical protein